MTCPNCNTKNEDGATFCNKCGCNLKHPKSSKKRNFDFKFYLSYAYAFLKEPIRTYHKAEKKFEQPKEAFFLGAVVSVFMMVVSLIKSMIQSIFVKTYDFYKGYKTTIDFNGLKNLNYFQLIFRNVLIYAAIIAFIALVYYLVSLVLKKNGKYEKFFGIVSSTMISYTIFVFICSPILGLIWNPLGAIALVAGTIYSIAIFTHLVNDSLSFKSEEEQVYYHVICGSITLILGYYILLQVLSNTVSGVATSGIFNSFI